MTKTTRCTDCGSEFTSEDLAGAGATGCPTCGTTSVPCSISEDVTVEINWHEMRILGIWASNYATTLKGEEGERGRRTLASVLRRLQEQHPDKPALSLLGEMRELNRRTGLAVDLHGPDGTVRLPKKDLD